MAACVANNRAFVFRGQMLALGWYWDGCDDPFGLSEDDRAKIRALVEEGANRVAVPYLAVDVGQLESKQWVIMEVGDGQFCGVSTVSPLLLWGQLRDALERA